MSVCTSFWLSISATTQQPIPLNTSFFSDIHNQQEWYTKRWQLYHPSIFTFCLVFFVAFWKKIILRIHIFTIDQALDKTIVLSTRSKKEKISLFLLRCDSRFINRLNETMRRYKNKKYGKNTRRKETKWIEWTDMQSNR